MSSEEFDQIIANSLDPFLRSLGFLPKERIRNGRWLCNDFEKAGWRVSAFYELGDWYADVRVYRPDGAEISLRSPSGTAVFRAPRRVTLGSLPELSVHAYEFIRLVERLQANLAGWMEQQHG